MKILAISFFSGLTLLLGVVLGFGPKSGNDIPALLPKHDAIGSAAEVTQINEAYDNALLILDQNPHDADARLSLVRIFTVEARLTGEHGHYYPAALEQAEKALQFATNEDQRYEALYLKAGVQLSQHLFEEALSTALKAYAVNNTHSGLYGTLVDAYTELGRYEEAVQTCDKMLALRPDLRAYSRASYLRELHGDLAGAVEAMEAAVEAGYPGTEERAWAAIQLAELYYKQGDYEKAKLCAEKVLEERPDYPFAIGSLAAFELKENHFENAEKLYLQAAQIIPEVSFYEGLCKVYRETNRQAEADTLYKEILIMYEEDIATGHQMNLDMATMIMELGGDVSKAKSLLERELEYRAENKTVQELKQLIDSV